MKKGLLVFITILITAAMLVACGSSKPKNMTQKTYDNGCRALEIMDKYNNMEISAEDAEDRLRNIQSSLITERETLTVLLEHTNNLLVESDIFLFITAMHGTTGSTYDNADELREKLGK